MNRKLWPRTVLPFRVRRLLARLVGSLLISIGLGLSSPADAGLAWSELPPLPDSLGFGGPAVGVHNDALIVAGGANFPEGPPWTGGPKRWHDKIYVLRRGADGQPATEWIEAGQLPKRLAYSGVVSTPRGILLIGGEVDGTPTAEVYRLTWSPASGEVASQPLPALPTPASYLGAGLIDGTVYVVGGGQSAGADRFDQKYFWSLDLEQLDRTGTATWQSELPPYPRAPRHKAVVAVQRDGAGFAQLYLMSGENPRFLPDGTPDLAHYENLADAYRYNPVEGKWYAIAGLPDLAGGQAEPYAEAGPTPVVAAPGVGVGDSHVLVFSGSSGYGLTQPLEERPVFPNRVLAYHTITNTWSVVGEMPIGVVTTGVAHWGDRYVIPSGEVRPGVRTNRVQAFTLRDFAADFGTVNYGILLAYLVGTLAVGLFFVLRTKSTDDYFRGGQRVPYWVAGLSIFATMLSSITFIALPAKAYATDWKYYLAQLTILPIALVVIHLAIPFFRFIDATSAYEYLERRFNYFVRAVASAQFILFQVARMAIVMYLPALALAAITPLSVMECVIVMGGLSVIYCTMGGVEAVVWTDALQTCVLLGGLIFALGAVFFQLDGSFVEATTQAFEEGKFHLAELDFSWGSWATTTAWVVFVGQFFGSLYSYTADQAIVQRYLTTKDEAGARRAMWTNVWLSVFGSSLFFAMGTALYIFYKAQPAALDVGMRSDAIFPLFIATKLPVGVAGLVVAGIFAAAQSTISTSMNSTATAVVTDFLMPMKVCKTDKGYLWLARIATALLGGSGTLMACWLVDAGSAMAIDAFITVIGLFGGAITGLFMLGILTRRANALGGLIGSLAGFGTVLWIMLDKSIAIHHFLYAAIGTIVTFLVGYGVSRLSASPGTSQLAGLTIYSRPT